MGNIRNCVRTRKPLLPDFKAEKIVPPNGALRVIVWEHYWGFWGKLIEPKGQKEKEVNQILGRLKTLFKKFLENCQQVQTNYTDYLTKNFSIEKSKDARILLQRLYYLFKDMRDLKNTSYAFAKPHKTLKHLTRIALFEGYLQNGIPGPLIKKIFQNTPLNEEESAELKGVTSRIKNRGMSLKELHKTLISLKAVLSPETAADAIVQMEHKLFEEYPDLFKEKDPKQMKWRSSLKKGDRIEEFELGEELKGASKEEGKHRVFAIVNRPDVVFVASINPTLLALRLFYQKHFNSGLKSPECIKLDPQGRFALFERFPYPVKNLTWESVSSVTKEDKELLQPFINLAKWCQEEEMFLSALNVDDLFFDDKDTLRSIKMTALTHYDIDALKKFLKELSKGNALILNYLEKAVFG